MQLKYLSTLTALGLVAAQETQDLNATLAGNEDLSSLTDLLGQIPEIQSTLNSASNITVLAPNNDAFSALMDEDNGPTNNTQMTAALLNYHVLNGTYQASAIMNMSSFIPTLLTSGPYSNVTGGQRVEAVLSNDTVTFWSGLLNNSTVSSSTNFTGGVVHVINRVLTVPQSASDTALAAGLTSLYGALNSTDMASTVDSLRDVTIFAPNNAAFQSIGSGLPNSTEELMRILSYHVVNSTEPGYSTNLMNGSSLTTLEGSDVKITTTSDNEVFVNGARVVIPNVLIAGGVCHVIDNVLNPNATTATPGPSATTGTPAFSGGSSATEAPFTTGVPEPTETVGSDTGSGGGGAGGGDNDSDGSAASTGSEGIAVPMKTGAVGAAALFGGAAAVINW